MKYMKFAVQVFTVAVSALVAALVDDVVDTSEWINVGIAALGAFSVLGAGELPAGVWSWMKTYVAFASAALIFLVSVLPDGLTTSELLQVILAGVGTLAVAITPGPKVLTAEQAGRTAAGLNPGPA